MHHHSHCGLYSFHSNFLSSVSLVPPSVRINASTNTVREGAPVHLECIVGRNDDNPNYTVNWTVVDKISGQNINDYHVSGNKGELLSLNLTLDATVNCNATVLQDDQKLMNSSSVGLTVARE